MFNIKHYLKRLLCTLNLFNLSFCFGCLQILTDWIKLQHSSVCMFFFELSIHTFCWIVDLVTVADDQIIAVEFFNNRFISHSYCPTPMWSIRLSQQREKQGCWWKHAVILLMILSHPLTCHCSEQVMWPNPSQGSKGGFIYSPQGGPTGPMTGRQGRKI